ncbi:hypothetical protein GGS21DRAFT_487798 [Xylaria nigripes]|nr:hypothetical protein GGS21DRAFT_487798 [Xylaria nigripes]
MAHTIQIQVSHGNSPTAHLRPPPLHIPQRKTVTIIDGDNSFDSDAGAGVTSHGHGTGNISPNSTLSQSRRLPGRYSQPDFTRSPTQRRGTSSKLKPLLSRFETLDAVSRADTSVPQYINSSFQPRPDTISRATGSNNQIIPPGQITHPASHTPVESISRPSSKISPCHVRTPPVIPPRDCYEDPLDSTCLKAVGDRNMKTDEKQLSVTPGSLFESHDTTSSTSRWPGQDPGIVANRRKLFEGNKSYCPLNTMSIPNMRQYRSSIESKKHSLPKSKSSPNNNSSIPESSPASVTTVQITTGRPPNKVVSKVEVSQKSSNDLTLSTKPSTCFPKQRPSVADLRQSFERFSQPVATSGEPTKLDTYCKLLEKSDTPQRRDMPFSNNSRDRSVYLEEPFPMPNRNSTSNPPLFGTDQISHLDSKPKNTKQASPLHTSKGLARQKSAPSLPKSQSSPQRAREDKSEILYRSANWTSLSQLVDEHLSRGAENGVSLDMSLDGLTNGLFSEPPTTAAFTNSSTVQHEQPVEEALGRNPPGIPKVMSSGNRLRQAGGKVSQLRKIFERSTMSISSPLSIMNLRPRSDQDGSTEALTANYSSPSWNEFASPMSTDTVARKHSIVPSLTTEISVNDFTCDFVGNSNNERRPAPTLPDEAVIEVKVQMKHESPVKHRIQQFEHMSRESLSLKAPIVDRDKLDNSEILSVSKDDDKGNGKRNVVVGWRPIQKKGAAIWRKISGSLNRPLESWKDAKIRDHERIDSNEGMALNSDPDCSTSLKEGLERRVRGSSSFGYSLDRVTHTSSQFVSAHVPSSVQLNGEELFPHEPEIQAVVSYGRSSPDPPLFGYKRFPIIDRFTSGLGHPRILGLDGHFLSKPVEDDELESLTATRPGPDPPQCGSKALHNVLSKQSAAERNRRRQYEKHLHREKRSHALAVWKGKGKANRTPGPVDGITTDEERRKRYGKGKEKQIIRRESKGSERRTSGEGEKVPNRKTDSGFVIFETKDVKLRHPRPRRPGQVRKLTNMYKEKGSSGTSVNTKANSSIALQESRQGLRQKASSALGLRGRKMPVN